MEDNVEIIKSNKGGMKVIYKGYMYTVHKRRQCGGIRWRCAQRSLHCKGSISTEVEGSPKINMPHNHLPDMHSIALARCRQPEDFLPAKGALAEPDSDSMPLQERLSKVHAQEKIQATTSGQILKSQPLSPTKLKVTRQVSKPVVRPERAKSPANEEMCLRWNSHHSNMQTAFPNILSKEQYVDVTLAAEGKTLKCHRLILSSCSPYFEEILSGISPFQHPVLFMKDIPFWILKSLCDFMYAGEVHISQNRLQDLLGVAEILKIKGLAGKSTSQEDSNKKTNTTNGTKGESGNHNTKKRVALQHKIQAPIKKQNIFSNPHYDYNSRDDENEDILDPLELLEPLYEEVAEEKKPPVGLKVQKEAKSPPQPVKKPFGRRLRKRKFSEPRDPSPPPVFSFRKGTRSRPNVKIPKFYHSDCNNTSKQNSPNDPLMDVNDIKTEPIDFEDNNLPTYSDEENRLAENCVTPPGLTLPRKGNANPVKDHGKFKKIQLKPIISEVRSVEESNSIELEALHKFSGDNEKTVNDTEDSECAKEDDANVFDEEGCNSLGMTIVSTQGAVPDETEDDVPVNTKGDDDSKETFTLEPEENNVEDTIGAEFEGAENSFQEGIGDEQTEEKDDSAMVEESELNCEKTGVSDNSVESPEELNDAAVEDGTTVFQNDESMTVISNANSDDFPNSQHELQTDPNE